MCEPLRPIATGFSRKAVQGLAKQIAKLFNFRPGDPPDQLPKRLHGKLRISDYLTEPSYTLLTIDPKGDFAIQIHCWNSLARDRFDVARGLGFYILHLYSTLDSTPPNDRPFEAPYYGTGRPTLETNWFALALLNLDVDKDGHDRYSHLGNGGAERHDLKALT